MTDASAEGRRLVPLIRCLYGLFFVSGAVGLIYEVVWLRKLLLVFGTTVYATSAVLTVFFGGLALGGWVFGRLIDRHIQAGLLWYAGLEAGIGLYAFATPWLFRAVEQVYIPLYRASGFSPTMLVGASFACTAAILLIPTSCLGGTFPIVSRFLIRATEKRGVQIASLYGINTLGAMAGTLFVYEFALQWLGWLGTLQCAGLMNLLIGVMAWALNRNLNRLGFRVPTEPSEAPLLHPDTPSAFEGDVRWLLVAFGVSGCSAMVYEVAWTRALSLVLGSSIYAFCIILATFLGGMALGSFAVRQYLRRRPASLGQVIVLELCLGAYGLFSMPLFGWLPDWFVGLWPLVGQSFAALSWMQALLSVSVMALPTFLMGVVFPIVSTLVTDQPGHVGRRLGLAYAVNTIGGIAGSFLCGFWLIPHIGIAWTLVVAALMNLIAGLLVYLRSSPAPVGYRLTMATVAVLVYFGLGQRMFVPSWQREALAAGVFMNPNSYRHLSVDQVAAQNELLFYRESLNTTVSVHREKGTRMLFLKVGGKTDASTGLDMGTQVLLAHLPLLIHPDAHRVLVIGLGSGVTLGSVGRYPVSVLDCAELDPAVVEGARYFADYNDHILEDPRLRMHVADGRNFLLATPQQYDVIISEPSNPWMAGIATLFTAEFYELAKRRLAPGGLMCQWFHLYRMFPRDVKLIMKTFQAVFPYVSVWSSIPGDVILIGSLEPHHLTSQRLQEALARPPIHEDLARIAVADPRVLVKLFWLGPDQVKQLVADIDWVHNDDVPSLEFRAPQALYFAPPFEVNYTGLAQWKAPTSVIAPDMAEAAEDPMFYTALGQAYRFRGELEKAAEALEQAVRLDSSNPTAQMELSEVYWEQGLSLKTQETLAEAIPLNPHARDLYELQARLFWQQGKREEALAVYDEAARVSIPDSTMAEEIGNALQRTQHFVEAAEYLRSARSQDMTDRISLIVSLAETLKDLHQWDDVAQVLQFAMTQHPEEGHVPLLLAHVRLEQGHDEEARQLFKRLVRTAPTAEAYFGLGTIALRQGDVPQAIDWLMTGLRYDPYNATALKTLREIQAGRTQPHG